MKALTAGIVVVLTACVIAAPALAGGIEQGTVELVTNTGFNYSSYSDNQDNGLTITNLRFGGAVGYFFTHIMELQVGMLVNHLAYDPDGGESSSTTDTGMGMAVVANFPTESSVEPFFGAGISFVAHGGDVGGGDKMTLNAPVVTGGLRFLVGNSASINLGVSYEHQTNALGYEDVSANVIMFDLGVSAFVSGGRAE